MSERFSFQPMLLSDQWSLDGEDLKPCIEVAGCGAVLTVRIIDETSDEFLAWVDVPYDVIIEQIIEGASTTELLEELTAQQRRDIRAKLLAAADLLAEARLAGHE